MRGTDIRLLQRLGRALRHGVVVSGVCVLIALVTGVGGYAFGERPVAAHGQVPPPRDAAGTSTEVLGRWLKPLAETPAPASTAPDDVVAAVEPSLEVVTVQTLALDTAEAGAAVPERRIEKRPGAGTVPLRPGDRTTVSLSFYYCESSVGAGVGDGGGFCGLVRDGSRVRPGVAACDVAYLGQRFRIEGDPTERTYVCADTGSAVHGMHRDIWFLDSGDGWGWQRSVGTQAVIVVQP